MDLDLDDLDFENDEIKRFLKHKLQEIEANNAKIERTISERRTYLQKILDDTNAGMDDSSASISFAWKKVFNEKYALGFTIQNNDRRSVSAYHC
ncbi:hypothetical protein JTB14_006515 [Gonioctena quinquepunctata]|nr:hypothetical protein JTB14_006515 [Gonioctena quinquepunctata]